MPCKRALRLPTLLCPPSTRARALLCALDMSSSDLNEDEGVLKRQMIELENQIHHLTRSNTEMKEILETEGSDPDLRGAIGENIVAIARQLTYPTCHTLSVAYSPRARLVSGARPSWQTFKRSSQTSTPPPRPLRLESPVNLGSPCDVTVVLRRLSFSTSLASCVVQCGQLVRVAMAQLVRVSSYTACARTRLIK